MASKTNSRWMTFSLTDRSRTRKTQKFQPNLVKNRRFGWKFYVFIIYITD